MDDNVAVRHFEALETAGIRAIQFKSSLGLSRAFQGEEDFDLLLHPDHVDRAIELAIALGFRRRTTTDSNACTDVICAGTGPPLAFTISRCTAG